MDASAIAATDSTTPLATQNRSDSDAKNAQQQAAAAAATNSGQSVPAVSQSTRRLVDIFV